MATNHGSYKWTLYGGGFEVDKLPLGRRRVTVRCKSNDLNTDYYYSKEEEIFKEFGDAYSLPLKEGGITSSWGPEDGEEYPNLVLVDQKLGFITGVPQPIITFTYETLTSEWANEDVIKTSSTENGLRVATQSQVAKSGVELAYDEDDIGVVTITNGGKTLYLAGISDQSSDVMAKVVYSWAEAGQISLTQSYDLDGLETLNYEFIGAVGTTIGRIVYRNTGNYDGFRTYIIRTLRKIDGTTIENEDVVHEQQVRTKFTYPGIASFSTRIVVGGYNGFSYYWGKLDLDRPSTAPITATMEIRYQDNGDIGDMPDNPDDAGNPIPYWAPDSWASLSADWVSSGVEPTSKNQAFEGYRVGDTDQLIFPGGYDKASFLGQFVYGSSLATLSGGPEDPEGNYYVLNDPTPELSFVDDAGTKWYKRTVIYAQIPERT